jgi:predicted ribosomally synthesized peptide with SipW-like signal peptide
MISLNQMKRIILSLAVIAVVAVVAVGATRAYFSDTVVASGNTFTSGTLSLKVDNDPSGDVYNWVGSFSTPLNPFNSIKPGDKGEQIVDIKKVGSVDGNATIKFDVTSPWNALPDNLNFVVTYDANHDGTFETPVASGPLTAWNHNTYILGPITSSETTDGTSGHTYTGKIASVKIVWSVPTTAGNNIQGQSIILDTTFGLNQVQ